MTIPHMTAEYAAAVPGSFRAICLANALQMAGEEAKAEPQSFWHGFCIRQRDFWTRQARRSI